jgi:pilus assembly protein CpaF
MAEVKKLRKVADAGLSDSLQKWIIQAEKEIGKTSIFQSVGNKTVYLLIAAPLAVGGVYMGVAYFHNLVAAVLLSAIGILLPEQIAYARSKTMQDKLLEQLGTAVRMFAAEFSETPNTIRVIKAIAPKMPSPIGEIFRQVDKEFTSGKDVNRVLINLSHKLSSEYGRLFVQLLRISFEDSSVKPMFLRLATRLQGQQKLIRKNRIEMTAERYVSIGMNTLIIPAYIEMCRIMPESRAYFANTATGRMIIVLALVSVIVGIAMDRMIGRGGELT